MDPSDTPTPLVRNQLPNPTVSKLVLSTPAQRPSTSSGEVVEPSSDLLRKALYDKRHLPQRPASTTPRRPRAAQRTQTYVDPWMPSDDEEPQPRFTRVTGSGRPLFRRRATDHDVARPVMTPSPPPSPVPGLGSKDEHKVLERLRKDNWDLKHRIMLQQEHANKLQGDLEAALQELERGKEIRQRFAAMEKERDRLKHKLGRSEAANTQLQNELREIADEVTAEMEQKDRDIRDRQQAIEEAAGIIQNLETRLTAVHTLSPPAPVPSPLHSVAEADFSDYYSGDQASQSGTLSTKSRPLPPTPAQDSDYFSIDNSPPLLQAPPVRPMTADSTVSVAPSVTDSLSPPFDRKLKLQSVASKTSLLYAYLENGIAPETVQSRTLKHKCSRLSTPKPSRRDASPAPATPQLWSAARPLRELYQVGELNRQVHSDKPAFPRSLSPSTLASISVVDDNMSDVFSRGGTTRPSSPSTSINTVTASCERLAITSSIELAPVLAGMSPVIGAGASTPILNYDSWTRKYPEWPPSASLSNRDLLFHADAADPMFAPSPSKDQPQEKQQQQQRQATPVSATKKHTYKFNIGSLLPGSPGSLLSGTPGSAGAGAVPPRSSSWRSFSRSNPPSV